MSRSADAPTRASVTRSAVRGAHAMLPTYGRATTDHTRRDGRVGQEGPSCG
jgi:hypothetical protein